jgi:hypothetical protein
MIIIAVLKDGKTAIDYASSNDIKELLRRHQEEQSSNNQFILK